MLYSPKPMHIPDGFLSVVVALFLWALAALFIGLALRQSRRELGEKTIPTMGVLAAFIFAGQAINFPVAGGTSGHLVGAALAAILLGPWPGLLTMACVVIVQGLLFQDGGILAMGGNLMNLAVLATLVGGSVYRATSKLLGGTRVARLAGAFFAAWVAVVASAMAAAIELAASGASPLGLVLPAMTLVHMLIGFGEGLITLGAVAFLLKVRPDLIEAQGRPAGAGTAAMVAAGLSLALVLTAFSPLASPLPDGLESVAERLQFGGQAQAALFQIFPDYTLRVAGSPAASTIAAVALGTILVFFVSLALARAIGRQRVPVEEG